MGGGHGGGHGIGRVGEARVPGCPQYTRGLGGGFPPTRFDGESKTPFFFSLFCEGFRKAPVLPGILEPRLATVLKFPIVSRQFFVVFTFLTADNGFSNASDLISQTSANILLEGLLCIF